MGCKLILISVLVFCSVLIDSFPFEQGNANQAIWARNNPIISPWPKNPSNLNIISPGPWRTDGAIGSLPQHIIGKTFTGDDSSGALAYSNTRSSQAFINNQALPPVTSAANNYNLLQSQSLLQNNQYSSNLNNGNYIPWPVPDVRSQQVFGHNTPIQYNSPLVLPVHPVPPGSIGNPGYGPRFKDQDKIVPTQSPIIEHPIYENPYIIVHENGTYENVANLNDIEWDENGSAHLKTKEPPNLIIAIIEIEGVKKTEDQPALEVPYDTGISKIPQGVDKELNDVDTSQSYNNLIVQTTTEDQMEYTKPEYLMPVQTTTENVVNNSPYLPQLSSSLNKNRFSYSNNKVALKKHTGYYNPPNGFVKNTPDNIVDTVTNSVTNSPLNAETTPCSVVDTFTVTYNAAPNSILHSTDSTLNKVNTEKAPNSATSNSYDSVTDTPVYNSDNTWQQTTTDFNTYRYTTLPTDIYKNSPNADNHHTEVPPSMILTTTPKTDIELQDSGTDVDKDSYQKPFNYNDQKAYNRHQLGNEKEPNDDITRPSGSSSIDASSKQTYLQNDFHNRPSNLNYYRRSPNTHYDAYRRLNPTSDLDTSDAFDQQIGSQNGIDNRGRYGYKFGIKEHKKSLYGLNDNNYGARPADQSLYRPNTNNYGTGQTVESSLYPNNNYYETEQSDQSSNAPINNDYGTGQSDQSSNGPINNNYETRQSDQSSNGPINNNYETRQSDQSSNGPINNDYGTGQSDQSSNGPINNNYETEQSDQSSNGPINNNYGTGQSDQSSNGPINNNYGTGQNDQSPDLYTSGASVSVGNSQYDSKGYETGYNGPDQNTNNNNEEAANNTDGNNNNVDYNAANPNNTNLNDSSDTIVTTTTQPDASNTKPQNDFDDYTGYDDYDNAPNPKNNDDNNDGHDTATVSNEQTDASYKGAQLQDGNSPSIDHSPIIRSPPRLRPDLEIDVSDLKKSTDKEMVWFRKDDSFWDKVTKGDQAYDALSVYNINCTPIMVERLVTVHHYPNGTKLVEYVDSIWDSPDAPHPREVKAKQIFMDQ